MKKYDFRFDKELLQSFIGKTFNKYAHPQFVYTKAVSLYVGFMVNDVSYRIENDYEALDYFGWDGEATVLKLYEKDWDDIIKSWEDRACITEVQEKIKSITIVNDHYSSFKYNEQDYDYWETRAIIFNFGEYEVSFTKNDCWFSMEIEVNKGNNLIEKVPDGKFILEDFEQSDNQRVEVEREIIELK